MDVERPHRDVDGEQLQRPAEALEQDRRGGVDGRTQYRQPLACHREQPLEGLLPLERGPVAAPRADDTEREEDDPEHADAGEARPRPGRDLGGFEDVEDQQQGRDDVEQPVREDGADEGRGRARAVGKAPAQHRDAGELADPAGQRRVAEEPHRERREHVVERRVWRLECLVDRQAPGERPHQHRDEVQAEREDDPCPVDEVEGVVDDVPVRTAPPEQRSHRREQEQRDQDLDEPVVPDAHAATERTGMPAADS